MNQSCGLQNYQKGVFMNAILHAMGKVTIQPPKIGKPRLVICEDGPLVRKKRGTKAEIRKLVLDELANGEASLYTLYLTLGLHRMVAKNTLNHFIKTGVVVSVKGKSSNNRLETKYRLAA